MQYLKWSLVGLVPMMLVAVWLWSHANADDGALTAFCQSTRGGEPWARTEERARERGFDIAAGADSRAARQEYLLINNEFGATAGCRIFVERGVVVDTRASKTPIRAFAPRE